MDTAFLGPILSVLPRPSPLSTRSPEQAGEARPQNVEGVRRMDTSMDFWIFRLRDLWVHAYSFYAVWTGSEVCLALYCGGLMRSFLPFH